MSSVCDDGKTFHLNESNPILNPMGLVSNPVLSFSRHRIASPHSLISKLPHFSLTVTINTTMMKLLVLLLLLLPLIVRTDDEEVTCFSCEADSDCDLGICVEYHCTEGTGLFRDGCYCQDDVECNSGLCRRVCVHTLDNTTPCTEDSDCEHGICSLHALCVEVRPAEPPKGGIMPFWMAVIAVVGSVGALLAFLCATRRESFYECCCDGVMNCCCLICDAC